MHKKQSFRRKSLKNFTKNVEVTINRSYEIASKVAFLATLSGLIMAIFLMAALSAKENISFSDIIPSAFQFLLMLSGVSAIGILIFIFFLFSPIYPILVMNNSTSDGYDYQDFIDENKKFWYLMSYSSIYVMFSTLMVDIFHQTIFGKSNVDFNYIFSAFLLGNLFLHFWFYRYDVKYGLIFIAKYIVLKSNIKIIFKMYSSDEGSAAFRRFITIVSMNFFTNAISLLWALAIIILFSNKVKEWKQFLELGELLQIAIFVLFVGICLFFHYTIVSLFVKNNAYAMLALGFSIILFIFTYAEIAKPALRFLGLGGDRLIVLYFKEEAIKSLPIKMKADLEKELPKYQKEFPLVFGFGDMLYIRVNGETDSGSSGNNQNAVDTAKSSTVGIRKDALVAAEFITKK